MPHATVLTINRRLARRLYQRHAESQRAQGNAVWETPDILPMDAWCRRSWASLELAEDRALPLLLNPDQEQVLWESVIRAHPASGPHQTLLHVPAAARQAREAWDLLHAWQYPLESLPETLSPDCHAFRCWAETFAARCEARAWICESRARGVLIDHIRNRRFRLPAELSLAGFFAEPTPQQATLIGALGAAGVSVRWSPKPTRAGQVRRAAFPDPVAEVEAAARWSGEVLETCPGASIGVVVPELERLRPGVARVFEDVLYPGWCLPKQRAAARAFNISLGQPLARVPLVRDALLSLELVAGDIPVAQWSHVLRSPFLAGAEEEQAQRALLDVRLRARGPDTFSLHRLIEWGKLLGRKPGGGGYAPVILERLKRMRRASSGAAARKSTGDWAVHFSDGLAGLGWPGERTLESAEYQAVEAFRDLLSQFSTLSLVAPRLRRGEALALLGRMAMERVFQPESEAAPIQILGTLETVGMEFTHLWIAGLHEAAWPRPAHPNPFLPAALQRRLGMPHAGAEQELEFARRETARLMASADAVMVSYPLQDGELALRPSPLIVDLPAVSAQAVQGRATPLLARHIQGAAPPLETWLDPCGPPLARDTHLRGGASALRNQAACPFRAFAIHRLGARAPESPVAGFDARVRGLLVHRALQLLWERIKDQQRLLAMGDDEAGALIRTAVAQSLEEMLRQRSEAAPEKLRELERDRLCALMEEWLTQDRQRAPFSVIASETARTITMGGLRMIIQPDRVDRLANGACLVVDYKTGNPRLSAWFGDRPDDPQLPLYCIAGEAAVAGAAFGVVRTGESHLLGIGEDGGIAPGIKSPGEVRGAAAKALGSWSELKADWQGVLQGLAEGLRAGDARVDPKLPGRTCRLCELTPLCRIHESDAGAEPPEASG